MRIRYPRSGGEQTVQQFARVLTDRGRRSRNPEREEHLDLRPVVSDITPDAMANGALIGVDASRLSPVGSDFTYLAPIAGVRQVAATGFNYKKHIEEFKMKSPTEPEVFLKAISSLTGPFDPHLPREQPRRKAGLGNGTGNSHGRKARTSPSPQRQTISSATSASTMSPTGRRRSMRKASNIWFARSRGQPTAPLVPI